MSDNPHPEQTPSSENPHPRQSLADETSALVEDTKRKLAETSAMIARTEAATQADGSTFRMRPLPHDPEAAREAQAGDLDRQEEFRRAQLLPVIGLAGSPN